MRLSGVQKQGWVGDTVREKSFRIIGASDNELPMTTVCYKISQKQFLRFLKKTGKEKEFDQSCRTSSFLKQTQIKTIMNSLVKRWEQEEHVNMVRLGPQSEVSEEIMDVSRFRIAYSGVRCSVQIRNALNLAGGGWFDKLDPYALARFRGSKQTFKTSILQDAGKDPVWNSEGHLVYNGELALELEVWDYDRHSKDDLVGTAHLQLEQIVQGYEGMVTLMAPGLEGKKPTRKVPLKQMMIVIGLQWDPPRDPAVAEAAAKAQALQATFGTSYGQFPTTLGSTNTAAELLKAGVSAPAW